MPSNPQEALALVIAVLLPLAVGLLGTRLARRSMGGWYQSLRKPVWSPPAWLFGPVWTILFLLMGVTSWLVWKEGVDDPMVRLALQVYAVQLSIHLLLAMTYFGLRQLGLAFLVSGLYVVAVALNVGMFYLVDEQAGLLLIPLVGWACFENVLIGAIRDLNRPGTLPQEPRGPSRRYPSPLPKRRRPRPL